MSTLGPEWEQVRQETRLHHRDSKTAYIPFDLMMEMPPEISGREAIAAVRDCMFRLGSVLVFELQSDAARLSRLIQRAEAPRALFWYVPTNIAVGLRFRVGASGHDLEAALEGEPLRGKILQVADALDVLISGSAEDSESSLEIELLKLSVDFIQFEEGSLYAWIKGHAEVLLLAATLFSGAAAAAAGPADHMVMRIVHQHRFYARVERALDNQPMVKYRGFRYNEAQFGYYAGNAFNFEEHGISDDERRHRIALVQLALKVYLGTNLAVDGEFGPDTHRNLVEFAKRHNHPASVRNPFTQADLLNELRPPEE